ncbi:sigma-70 family RNA polymerase sigma factor [Robiginitalea sp. M366]|uniref:RNA polymerase sigma factor n=1 Tax=Robiginitalea aestuariiviva TaxID=3036903 RepID=UPI00240D5FAF|nr:sigma-70 family RNA polymerase sigma factor [Robiginitalea aestuariiviva]MDG1573030.1 sigma-70 family RNA polymerase sigma factor [Robiginitalea aestuariiviva]
MELLQAKDATLIQKYTQGDERALEVLINRYNTRLSSFIYSKVFDKEITEDIFQDTFVKVIRTLKRGKYNEEGKFLPWVIRIAHNLIIDHFRKSNRMPRYEMGEEYSLFSIMQDGSLNAEHQLIQDQITEDLASLIRQLPEDQQKVLQMRMYQEMSFKEIAERTGVSINTALGRMRYALINLRRLIEEHSIVLTN